MGTSPFEIRFKHIYTIIYAAFGRISIVIYILKRFNIFIETNRRTCKPDEVVQPVTQKPPVFTEGL